MSDLPSIADYQSWQWVERSLKRTLSEQHRRAVVVICSIAPPYRVGVKWGRAEWFDFGGLAVVRYGELATFDSNDLTLLVIAAHDHCMRVSVEGVGPRYMRIVVHPRRRDGDICTGHPTLGQALSARGRKGVC